ncbi:uncharacterized protein LOC120798929 [Xiphias gladius]|uniref:uncharacterized protein LOC120798929 n=1 Tax=Xiphias gladius TaxID=8245 RepID=UPI001A98B67A|nr:uncharacterized protein LOC120798929 [Xiphias gladius]
MSASVVNLQAQVESVLGALVKAATVELTKLFESRYRGSAVGRTEDKRENEMLERLDTLPPADTKRSIGVQVDEGVYPLSGVSGPPSLSDGDGPGECKEVGTAAEGCPIPSEVLLAEDKGHVDPERSPLEEQALAETVDTEELSVLETESRADSDAQAEVVLRGKKKNHGICAETWTETLKRGSTQRSPAKQKPLVIQPDTSDIASGGKVKFVCPLILKPDSPAPKPDSLKKSVQAEPQQACVSSAR